VTRGDDHPHVPAPDLVAYAHRLGIPEGAAIYIHTIDQLERHHCELAGYRWQWVAYLTSAPVWWPDGMATAFIGPHRTPMIYWQIVQWLVYHPHKPGYGEFLWHPHTGVTTWAYLPRPHTKQQRDELRRAMTLTLNASASPGRPRRFDDDVLDLMVMTYVHQRLAEGHRPFLREVAAWMDAKDPGRERDRRSTEKYLARFYRDRGCPNWPAVLDRARIFGQDRP
jgi:hypothetical protein